MEYASPIIESEVNRHQLAERVARATAPKISSTTHRHLLARGLRRFADRLEG